MVSIFIVQVCKLLPLVGLSSLVAIQFACLLLSYISPFLDAESYSASTATSDTGLDAALMASKPPVVLGMHFIAALCSSVWASDAAVPELLSLVLHRELAPTSFQTFSATSALLLFFLSSLLLFYRGNMSAYVGRYVSMYILPTTTPPVIYCSCC